MTLFREREEGEREEGERERMNISIKLLQEQLNTAWPNQDGQLHHHLHAH